MKRMIIQLCMCLFLTAHAATAQTIKIEDDNFKRALIKEGVDLNGDGEIQAAEALKVTKLYVGKQHIESLSGIRSFTNMVEFGFFDNDLIDANFQGMTKLRSIFGFNNKLEHLNVKGCINLELIYTEYNKITEIDLNGLSKLKELHLQHNNLLAVDVSGKPLLVDCQLDNNSISSFKSAGSTAIKRLRLDVNQCESLNLTHLKDLEELSVYDNRNLAVLKIFGLRKLKELSADYCRLTNLNMSGTVSLKKFSW